MSAPLLFDRALIRHRLGRAVEAAAGNVLLDRVAEEMVERLSAVNRPFVRIADVGTPGPALAARLERPGATVLRVAAAPEPRAPGLLLAVGDEERLPLAPGRFDLIVSALALQGVNDLPGALVQMRRALKPDGFLAVSLLGGDTLRELRTVLAAAETAERGGVSPRVAPFVEIRDAGGLLQRAGFALPVSDTELFTLRYPHLFALLDDLRQFGAANPLVARERRGAPRALFARAAAIYAERFADPDGRIRATFDVLHLAGWAPHESQQKPLAPGSGKTPLAEALKPVR